ncbi:MAG: sugar-binding domain-containing protein, partial [Anaerolineales bacterium]
MHSIVLDGTWSVRPESFSTIGAAGLAAVAAVPRQAAGWLPAQVPGEIHLDLIRAGQMPEPSVSTNMPDCRWPETKSWWYRTSFILDEAFTAHERQQLVFDGLDLYAQVFVNGQLIGEAANAFVPAIFDVKGRVSAGENEMVVRLTAGSELAKDAAPHPEQNL